MPSESSTPLDRILYNATGIAVGRNGENRSQWEKTVLTPLKRINAAVKAVTDATDGQAAQLAELRSAFKEYCGTHKSDACANVAAAIRASLPQEIRDIALVEEKAESEAVRPETKPSEA